MPGGQHDTVKIGAMGLERSEFLTSLILHFLIGKLKTLPTTNTPLPHMVVTGLKAVAVITMKVKLGY